MMVCKSFNVFWAAFGLISETVDPKRYNRIDRNGDVWRFVSLYRFRGHNEISRKKKKSNHIA